MSIGRLDFTLFSVKSLTLGTILLLTFGYALVIKFYCGINITMWHKYSGANTSFCTIFLISERKLDTQTYNNKKTNIDLHNDRQVVNTISYKSNQSIMNHDLCRFL